jgi:broad specificity phosphatase PhoE
MNLNPEAFINYIGQNLLSQQGWERNGIAQLTGLALLELDESQRNIAEKMLKNHTFDQHYNSCYLAGQQTAALLAVSLRGADFGTQMYANALIRCSGQEAKFPVSDFSKLTKG